MGYIAFSKGSDKGFGYAFGIDVVLEATRLSKSRMREEMDVGGEAMSRGIPSEACLSFVSTGVREGERGDISRRERTCVAIAGRIGGLCYDYIYSPSLPLVS